MNIGSHCSDGPHVPNGMEMVACNVAGLSMVGLLNVWLFRALTAAMSAAVAWTCAKSGDVLADGLYRILMPEVAGLRCQAVVRLALQVDESERVSTTGPCKKNARRPGLKSQNTSSKKSQNVKKVSTLAIPKVSRGPKICFRDFGRNLGLT